MRSAMQPPTERGTRSPAGQGRLGMVLLSSSVMGVPLVLFVLRRLGRWGGLLVEAGCGLLFVRDVTMTAAGAPARLRPLPRLLLLVEVVVAGVATSWACGHGYGGRSWADEWRTRSQRPGRARRDDRPRHGLERTGRARSVSPPLPPLRLSFCTRRGRPSTSARATASSSGAGHRPPPAAASRVWLGRGPVGSESAATLPRSHSADPCRTPRRGRSPTLFGVA